MKKWWQFWTPNEEISVEEKVKRKNMTADEINEMLIAAQAELQEALANAQAVEAVTYFNELYPMITSGDFGMDAKNKRLILETNLNMPSSIEAGKILQVMFRERGYRIIHAEQRGKWIFGLTRDAAEGAGGYFDGVYYRSGQNYWD